MCVLVINMFRLYSPKEVSVSLESCHSPGSGSTALFLTGTSTMLGRMSLAKCDLMYKLVLVIHMFSFIIVPLFLLLPIREGLISAWLKIFNQKLAVFVLKVSPGCSVVLYAGAWSPGPGCSQMRRRRPPDSSLPGSPEDQDWSCACPINQSQSLNYLHQHYLNQDHVTVKAACDCPLARLWYHESDCVC